MGKPKKGRQARQDENGDEDIETDLTKLSLTESVEDANEVESKPVSKKKEKKAAKAKALSDEEDSDAEAVPAGGKKGKAGFQLLALGSDDEMKSESEEEEVAPAPSKKDKKKQKKQISVEEDDEEDGPAEPAAKQQPKKKNKKEKKQKEVEEDLDAILAEIDGPAKKSKKKKKGKETSPGADHMEPEEVKEPEPSAASKAMEGRDLSAMTQDEIAALLDDDDDDDMDDRRKKKKKDKKPAQKEQAAMEEDEDGAEGDDAATSTVKTKAQKQKEKRERQKQQKQLEKTKPQKKPEKQPEAANEGKMETSEVTGSPAAETSDVTGSPAAETSDVAGAPAAEAAAPPGDEDKADDRKEGNKDDDDDGGDKKKKKRKDKKKNKGEEEEEKEKKKKPSKMAMAILEQQKKLREEEDRIKQEEEERQRKIDEAYQEKEDKAKREKEKRELVKQKKKEKIERLKAEGKFMTEKEKEAKRRAAQMLEALKAQGVEVPQVPAEATKKKKIVYDTRKKKVQKQTSQEEVSSPNAEADAEPRFPVEVDGEVEEEGAKEKVNEPASVEPPAPEEKEDIKDSWDVESEEEEEEEEDEEEEEAEEVKSETKRKSPAGDEKTKDEDEEDEESGSEEESDEDSDEGSEESDSEEDSEDDGLTAAERAREKALARIEKRKDEAEKNRSFDVLRAPVVCVLGHVDTGKTKILDKLRRTHVQDDEAGGITQQIGATNVPMDAIKENTKMCKEFTKKELKVPGLLIIDTPGHESFSNLRSRGSSLCDIAILVVDIMHGLEPQTIESINLLKQRKTPFIVALNKVDRLYMWQSNPHNDVVNTLKKQKINTKQEFDERTNAVIVQFSEQGLNACLFHENKNPREYVSLVPTSAHSGDGMGNLLALTCELTQSLLAKRLAYSENLQATVMEVKAIQGLGTTIDVILVNGCVKEGETIIVAGQEGPIITQIRGLLMPQPMRELRVKSAYEHHKEVHAAQGVKIIAKDLDKALAGLPMHVAYHPDEVAVWKDDIAEALSEVLDSIKLTERGVFVQASTLGSLEALLEFLRTSKIPYAGINIGPVHKKDVMKASVMLEHDNQYATILAFDVKVEREAQEMADSLGVRIFTAEIIYHLFDKFTAFRTELKRRKQEEFKNVAVFPCKVRILPQYIFNSRDPIVMGVVVDAGFLKVGTPICVPSKEFVSLGRISSLELNNKNIDKAVKGQEVCIKIENPGETPKMFGRHFDATDLLISKISRDSIDAVKNYFREEMGKNDWQLMVELKKLFEII